jgi:hypothetical protein
VEATVHMFGFFILLGLILLVTAHDIRDALGSR